MVNEVIINIYADGGCRGNPGPGGWGVLLQAGDTEKELWGGEANTTNNRMELTAAIRALAQEKRTMVIVTHEMSFARDVADRAIFMDQGRIVEQGVAKALFADPQQPRTRQFLEKFLLQ